MNSKMGVLFMKRTGHVVAAFTCVADPERKIAVADLVGVAFPVRTRSASPGPPNQVSLLVPAQSLDIATVEFNEDVFVTPSSFVASGTTVDLLGNVIAATPDLREDKITVKAAGLVTTKTVVWAQVQQVNPPPGEEPVSRVVQGEIEENEVSVDLVLKRLPDLQPASIPTGDYEVAVLVAGQRPFFGRLTVPQPSS